MNKNFGYIKDEIKETDYILGGQTPIEGAILSPTGQWLNRISGGEAQRRFGVETMSCVSFGTLNIVEILIKELFSVVADYSDRYLSSMAETTPQGNSPTKVFDTLRKEAGCIDEQDLPFSESVKSFNDYIVPLFQMPKNLIRKGEEWRSKFDLKYERAFNGGTLEEKRKQIIEGLKRSPLGVSVYAWVQNEKGLYYKPSQSQDNHFTLLVGYEEGIKWFVYDSYPESEGDFIKELDWNYDFGCAFVFYLRNIEKELKWYEEIINILAKVVGLQAVFVAEVLKKNSENMNTENKPKIEEVKSRIIDWASAIEKFENSPKEWNNPGSIKSLKGNYLKFKTYQEGFDYLCDYLVRASTGKHKAYNPEMTLLRFFEIYAPASDKNNPKNYAKFVADSLGVDITIKIKELLKVV
jgi:hypothetical protein